MALARRRVAAVVVWLCVGASSAFAQPCLYWSQDFVPGPPARRDHAMVYDSDRNKVILIGGIDSDESGDALKDVWEWDVATRAWTDVTPNVGGLVDGIFEHAMAYDAARKRVVITGGRADTGDDPSSETLEYDPAARVFYVGQDMGLGRARHAMAYDAARQRIVVFGGHYNEPVDGMYLTPFTQELIDGEWVTIVHQGVDPDGRIDAAMAPFPPGGVMLSAGTRPAVGGGFGTGLDDFWVWNGTTWTGGGPTMGDLLGATDHQIVFDASRARLVLFGGSHHDSADDATTFGFPVGGPAWTVIDTGEPTARAGHAMVYVDATDEVLLFGGRKLDDEDDAFGDTWILSKHLPNGIINAGQEPVMTSAPCGHLEFSVDVNAPDPGGPGPFTYQWRKRESEPNGAFLPIADNIRRSGTQTDTLTVDPGRPEDFGSYDVQVTNACGTTELAPAIVNMIEASFQPGAGLPTPRMGMQMAYDRERDSMVFFSGDVVTSLNPFRTDVSNAETWKSVDGGPWQLASNVGQPGRRSDGSMGYDEKRKVVVLYGGRMCEVTPFACANGNVGSRIDYTDTWEWNGATWTQIAVNGPPHRIGAPLVWDPIRQKLVLFGGMNNANIPVNDMWEYDGTAWTQVAQLGDPTHGIPLGRNLHCFAFDRSRGVFVMHGGQHTESVLQPRGDTWEFAGTQWTYERAEPENGRLGLRSAAHAACAYDEEHDALLLFSPPNGNALANPFGTIRQWTGSAWVDKVTAGVGWRQFGPRMQYDDKRERVVLAGGGQIISELPNATHEWVYFEYEPTCGSVACGDGLVDAPEQCDPEGATADDCCAGACTFVPEDATCGSVACDGACTATGQCVCDIPTCGDGEVDGSEVCDDPACCPACTGYVLGPCGNPCRGDVCEVQGGGVPQCYAGDDDQSGCDPSSSIADYVPASGGTLETPNDAVAVTFPPGAAGNFSIARLASSQFGVGTPETLLAVARLEPEGAIFPAPYAKVTFRWDDVDANGVVDGTSLDERDLRVFKNGVDVTGRCGAAPATCGTKCCNTATNELSVHVSSFSEFALAAVPPVCATLASPKLSLAKILPPVGDDGLTFEGKLALAAAAPLDPVAHGMRVALTDGNGTVLDVTLPSGAYAKATKAGWKANKKRTAFTFTRPVPGAPNGIVKAKVTRKKDVVTVKVNGKAGTYAATPPLHATIALDTGEPCATTRWEVGEESCVVKSKGKALKCK